MESGIRKKDIHRVDLSVLHEHVLQRHSDVLQFQVTVVVRVHSVSRPDVPNFNS
jgi:hypothetical protein